MLGAVPNPVLIAYRECTTSEKPGFFVELLTLLAELEAGTIDLRVVVMVTPSELIHARAVIGKHLTLIGKIKPTNTPGLFVIDTN
jgi:hypothetical protein